VARLLSSFANLLSVLLLLKGWWRIGPTERIQAPHHSGWSFWRRAEYFPARSRHPRCHFEKVCNRIAFVFYRQRLPIIALPQAGFAQDMHIRQKTHFDSAQPISPGSLRIGLLLHEAESPGLIAANAGFRKHGEQFPYRGEKTRIGGGI